MERANISYEAGVGRRRAKIPGFQRSSVVSRLNIFFKVQEKRGMRQRARAKREVRATLTKIFIAAALAYLTWVGLQ